MNEIRSGYERGIIGGIGELSNQYTGLSPNSSEFVPYFALAEELNIPVAIHTGMGPPGASLIAGATLIQTM